MSQTSIIMKKTVWVNPEFGKEQLNVILTGLKLHSTVHGMTKKGPGIDYGLGIVG